MTFSNILATAASKDGYTVTAYETYEKFAAVPRYEIVTSKDGVALWVDKVARTTWKKKFKKITEGMSLW